MSVRPVALVTGASSGIGLELARQLVRGGYDAAVTARRSDELRSLRDELAPFGAVHVFPKDLARPGAAAELADELRAARLEVSLLINNAGVGTVGPYLDTPWERTERMIQLNVTALAHLTRLLVPDMVRRGQGRVMNVASTAAFQPGPLMAAYYATKAFVLHFSEALSNELKGSGVTVTALCPGPTLSGFQAAAGMGRLRLLTGRRHPSSEDVARFGLAALMRGDAVAVPGWDNRLLTFAVRFAPRSWVASIVRWLQEARRD